MVDRFYGYQYDTSPRKLNPEHIPYRNRYPRKEEPVSTRGTSRTKKRNNSTNRNNRDNRTQSSEVQEKCIPEYRRKQVENREKTVKNHIHNNNRNIEQSRVNNDTQNTKRTKNSIKPKLKIVLFLITGFSVLFAISYQNSLISETFNKKEQYKKEMEALSKTNQQIEVSIENSLNLKNIEEAAKDKIGMQKLNNNQKIYVSLPKEDYIAPASEQIVMDEELGFFQKLIKGFTKSIN